jgi:hypothetical protein
VQPQQVRATCSLLQTLGWQTLTALDDRTIAARHAISLANADGIQIDLHWRVFGDSPRDQWLMNFKPQTMPAQTFSAMVFCPEDQLLHTLVHGLRYSPVSLVRWIPDAAWIIRQSQKFRWDYFFSQTKTHRLEDVVKRSLIYLQKAGFIKLPPSMLERIDDLTPRPADQTWFVFLMQERDGLLYPYRYIWHAYARNHGPTRLISTIMGLPSYLKQIFGIESNFALLGFLIKQSARQLEKRLKRPGRTLDP